MSNYAIFALGVFVGIFAGFFIVGIAVGVGQFIWFGGGGDE